ncbi:MAG: hypothetical protein A2X13_10280 [Bacteroidetes bacterium GWC2_33_15]|nr:MAG: hypothetical protein A2X10_02835 [Bacteroidetes bacterium GWA2_33_15]OFX48792.1 MAG: hypothetical protein A2X13_10280 [Bacteroidetes bacterium GWC2_33_15]OFX66034.1 MAG: hypothetical protein A2X15_11430 [Bacteroidetes bacterium GWB2_32_14]OFX68204.1 MAG: hypothetical protein A2X14_07465 [Bacteroidetes bacterium GWD2_33_33]HAN17980.1 hypothetical protein [Bacteroidales bacterium]
MKRLIQIVLAILMVVLAYLVWESIQTPIRFNKEKDKRYTATIQRLKDIRTAQIAFKDEYGRFTGSFDTLINFIEHDSMKLVKAIGSIPDDLLAQGWTEAIALKEGIITRDTIRIAIKDTLFPKEFTAQELWKVPFTENAKFELATAKLMTGSVKVDVFEAKIHNDILLSGLDRQLIINLNERMKQSNNYPGVKVGDIAEPNNNAGNWE